MLFVRFLHFFFRHFYTTLAWSYDLVAAAVSIGQWRSWVRTVLEPWPAEPVLEIGFGPGHLILELASRDTQAFGADASRQMCRIAQRRLLRHGYLARLVQARADALPFESEAFRTLVSTFPTEYVVDPDALGEAYRVLFSGGSYRVTPMAEITGKGLLDRAAARLFGVTGQYQELPPIWTEPMVEAGLTIRREDVSLSRAKVVRIVATKN